MNISFNGINESIVTFLSQGEIKPGCLVSPTSDNTVKQSDTNSSFIGLCISNKSGLAAVQISGFATIKIKTMGSTTYGRQYFVADDDGSLKLSEASNGSAVPLNVVSIDKTNSTVDVFL